MDQLALRLQLQLKPKLYNGTDDPKGSLIHALRKLRKGKPVQVLFTNQNRESFEFALKDFEARLNALCVPGEAYAFAWTKPHDARAHGDVHSSFDVSIIITDK